MNDKIDSLLTVRRITPNILRMNLKSQLKYYLDLRAMTAAELARKSGVSKQVLSQWLAGAQPRRIEQVKKVAEALKTSVDALCFGNGMDKKNEQVTELEALLGDGWISGLFEVRFRRVKKGENKGGQ